MVWRPYVSLPHRIPSWITEPGLSNSYLGNNSTISCRGSLTTPIFPAHEQHHNNSFLCASWSWGKVTAAEKPPLAKIHNSRSADEIPPKGLLARLCEPSTPKSLRHSASVERRLPTSSRTYPSPSLLISHDVPNNRLVIMPAYCSCTNMYRVGNVMPGNTRR